MKTNYLWSTLLIQDSLPSHEENNEKLKEVILERNKNIKNMTNNYREHNFLRLENENVSWLTRNITTVVEKYIIESKIKRSFTYNLDGWANVNVRGDYHVPHTHPFSWLSGVYYVDVPIQDKLEQNRLDIGPAHISFFDPRGSANMIAIQGDLYHRDEHRVLPQSGDIFIFPSFLQHMAHPNMSDKQRISISFNITINELKDYTY